MPNDDARETADFISSRIGEAPRMALVLGSGLGGLADELEDPTSLNYQEIPHFPVSTAPGHAGKLVAGSLGGKRVVAMQGRFHYYEGHPLERVAFPVRVFKLMGISRLFLTNAAGGANPYFTPGDFMVIRDHLNLTGQNPCVGPNDEALGQRFFDMTKAYSPELRDLARKAGEELGIPLREGVYAWFSGPSFETPAEIRMARILGADAVGMSTVPEVIEAAHCGLEVLGLSCITNMAAGILDQAISGDEVLEMSARRRPQFSALVRRIVALAA